MPKQKHEKQIMLDMYRLVVLQVSGLVEATAQAVARNKDHLSFFKIQYDLYRNLAVNCQTKAELTESLMNQAKAMQKGKAVAKDSPTVKRARR